MRSKLTEATCNIRTQTARPPATSVGKRQLAAQTSRTVCRRDHRSRWSFPAPSLPPFPHPGHATKTLQPREWEGGIKATHPAPSAPSACPISSFHSEVEVGTGAGRRSNLYAVAKGHANLARIEVGALRGTSRATCCGVGLVEECSSQSGNELIQKIPRCVPEQVMHYHLQQLCRFSFHHSTSATAIANTPTA